MKHFYISYHISDLDWAEWVAKQLEEVGYSISLQSWDSSKPGNYLKDLKYNATFANGVIILMSPDYFDILPSIDEWISLLLSLSEDKDFNMIAIRVQECSLYALLPESIFFLDIVGLNKTNAKKNLIKAAHLSSLMVPDLSELKASKSQRFITGLPRIWNIPYTKNPNFTGRDRILTKLHKLMHQDELKKRRIILHGLSGVGKTRLAVEYAYKYSNNYDLVWWLRAEKSTTITNDFLDLAIKLKLIDEEDKKQYSVIENLLYWLKSNQYWLLIFDNVEDFNIIEKYLPDSDSGNVLFTSRNPSQDNMTIISVPALNRSDSIELLLNYTGLNDKKSSNKLAEELGDLPLALEQVSTYIKENDFTIINYLNLLKRPGLDFSTQIATSLDYPETITTVFDISFQKADEQLKGSIDFLNLLAFLAPDDIPIVELSRNCMELSKNLMEVFKSDESLDRMLKHLESYSLIVITANTISIHRLIQKIVRDRINPDGKLIWINKLLRLMNEMFNFDRKALDTWKSCSRLFPHILALFDNAKDMDIIDDVIGILLNKLGDYLIHIEEFKEAEKILHLAHSTNERAFGPVHPEVAKVISNLGGIKFLYNDYEDALQHTKKAYEIYKSSYGQDNTVVAEELINIGYILIILDEFKEALKHYKEAMDINVKIKGLEHPDVGNCLIDIGYIKVKLGNQKEGLGDVEKGLEILEKGFGLKHPLVSIAYVNLGTIFKEIGDYKKAFECFEKSYIISKEIFGANNSKIGRALMRLGLVKLELGMVDEALSFFEKGLTISKKLYGLNHVDVGLALRCIGDAMRRSNDINLAKLYYQQAIKIFVNIYKPAHHTIKELNKAISELEEDNRN